MKFINDMSGEITGSVYSINNGKIVLKIQYRSKAKGFLICVSEIFSQSIPMDEKELLDRLDGCVEKSGNSVSYVSHEKEYQFFYVTEDKVRTRDSELTLPGSVKSPAKIDIFWIDDQRQAHLEQEKIRTLIIPISIAVKLDRRKKGLLKKEYFCDIHLTCLSGENLTDHILYYRVNRKEICYPIPGRMVKNGMITLKTEEEFTDITIEVYKEYKKFYKLQVSS